MKIKLFRGWVLGAFFTLNVVILAIGIPRFLSELMLVPGTPILHLVGSAQRVPVEQLQVLERSRLNAIRYSSSAKSYIDLGSTYLAFARLSESLADKRRYAQLSNEFSVKGLEISPLNSYAWLRVAAANIYLGQNNHRQALSAWRRSIDAASFEPTILMQRIHLGIMLYDIMAPKDISKLKSQFTLAYHWNREKVRRYLLDNDLIDWGIFLSTADGNIADFLVTQSE